MTDVRDFEPLLNAARHMVIDGYEFMLVMVGGGRAETKMRKLLATLGLSHIAVIGPRLSSLASVLSAADIFIQPRPTATFDPLLLEAMSAGTAVAACKGGVDDLLIEDRTCVLFEPDDELSINNCICQLFNAPERARKLAQSAQNYVKENHSVSKMIASILETYHDAPNWPTP